MPPADQRGRDRRDALAYPLGQVLGLQALDVAVDHDEAEDGAVVELLRRQHDARQHEARLRIGCLEFAGGGEDVGAGHPLAGDQAGFEGTGFGRHLGEAALDHQAADLD